MNFLRETSYRGLPAEFFAAAPPSPAPSPHWIVFNDALAAQLGLPEGADTPQLLELLAGGAPPQGGENIALAYSGHQFGQWNPLLGDGRAAMVGEIVAPDGESVTTSISRGRGRPHSPGAATAARRCRPCCANISSARPWPG